MVKKKKIDIGNSIRLWIRKLLLSFSTMIDLLQNHTNVLHFLRYSSAITFTVKSELKHLFSFDHRVETGQYLDEGPLENAK